MTSAANNNNINQHNQVLIKRAQHNGKLSSVLNNMLQMSSLVDVTIYCDDGQVNAHKLVLAASSSYFRDLFSRITNTFQYPIIVLRDIPVDDLKTIIQFIYYGEVNVPQNRVESLLRCANYLKIDVMASSANSLNAVLAQSTSSITHHSQMPSSAHSGVGGPLGSAISNNLSGIGLNNASFNKFHPQYPPQNNNSTNASNGTTATGHTKSTSRGHGSRTNNHHNNHLATNNTSSGDTGSSSGKPRHTCHICLKTFTHGFTLTRHMKLHSQSRHSIYCDVCSKSYSCKDSFLRHKKSSGHLQHAEFHHRPNVNIGSGV